MVAVVIGVRPVAQLGASVRTRSEVTVLAEDLRKLGACKSAVMHAQTAGWKSLDDARDWHYGVISAFSKEGRLVDVGDTLATSIAWAWWLVARLYPLPETLIYLQDVLGDPHLDIDAEPHRLFKTWWVAPQPKAYWRALDLDGRDTHWRYMLPTAASSWSRMLRLLWLYAAPYPHTRIAVHCADIVNTLVYAHMCLGEIDPAQEPDLSARRLACCKKWAATLELISMDRLNMRLARNLRRSAVSRSA